MTLCKGIKGCLWQSQELHLEALNPSPMPLDTETILPFAYSPSLREETREHYGSLFGFYIIHPFMFSVA